jgi:hypothetical protein
VRQLLGAAGMDAFYAHLRRPGSHPISRRARLRQRPAKPGERALTPRPRELVRQHDAERTAGPAYHVNGRLAALGRFATGGRGTGMPHVPSQSSIVLDDDDRRLLVVSQRMGTAQSPGVERNS